MEMFSIHFFVSFKEWIEPTEPWHWLNMRNGTGKQSRMAPRFLGSVPGVAQCTELEQCWRSRFQREVGEFHFGNCEGKEFFFFFGCAMHHVGSYLTRDCTCVCALGVQSLNHQTTREVAEIAGEVCRTSRWSYSIQKMNHGLESQERNLNGLWI